ncbi:MAG: hypothetical protein Q9167_004825 [Letrouitia subvulpina]
MPSSASCSMLSRARACSARVVPIRPARKSFPSSATTAAFSTSLHRPATPSRPPSQGFRLPPTQRWDEGKETSLDKAGNYFLMTEMARGMYVVLEQFFRPPAPSHRVSAVNMLSAVTLLARSAASPASSVKRYVQLLPLQLKRKSGKMVVGERQDTT